MDALSLKQLLYDMCCGCACHGAHVVVREQLCGAGSLLPHVYGHRGLNSVIQLCADAVPANISFRPCHVLSVVMLRSNPWSQDGMQLHGRGPA